MDALSAWALADAVTTLSPDHPVNRALIEAGAGAVPRLIGADAGRRVATVDCRPLRARLEVPFGWHAIEHEALLAVFEPGRQIQIQLGLVDREGRDAEALLDQFELDRCGQRPAPGALRLHHAGWHALALRETPEDRIPLEEYHLLTPGRDALTLTHARVIATPSRGADAVGLAEALLAGLVFDRASVAAVATNETRPALR